MARIFSKLNTSLKKFIEKQHIFFVGTADVDGKVNVSPKGLDSLRILDDSRVIWLNLTGSGNETAAHLLGKNRMTIMFCSFDETPLILRLYGQAITHHTNSTNWEELLAYFPNYSGARQIFELQIEAVQTSCGYAVPFYEFGGERKRLNKWTDDKGEEKIKDYWQEKNVKSIDGKDTGMPS